MSTKNKIIVNHDVISINEHYDWLSHSVEDGAIVTFTGKVRTLESKTTSLYLEHYQGMTEDVLHEIVQQARSKWNLNRVLIIHRVGEILANEDIVYVGVSAGHRKEAFAAAEFIMDILKTKAPFWKKEKTKTDDKWVEAKKTDKDALKKWY